MKRATWQSKSRCKNVTHDRAILDEKNQMFQFPGEVAMKKMKRGIWQGKSRRSKCRTLHGQYKENERWHITARTNEMAQFHVKWRWRKWNVAHGRANYDEKYEMSQFPGKILGKKMKRGTCRANHDQKWNVALFRRNNDVENETWNTIKRIETSQFPGEITMTHEGKITRTTNETSDFPWQITVKKIKYGTWQGKSRRKKCEMSQFPGKNQGEKIKRGTWQGKSSRKFLLDADIRIVHGGVKRERNLLCKQQPRVTNILRGEE